MGAGIFAGRPGKLLVCFVGRRRGDNVVAAAKAAGARGGTVALGKALGDSAFLRALALADIPQDVIFIVLGEEANQVEAAVIVKAAADGIAGQAVLLAVPQFFLRAGASGQPAGIQLSEGTEMESNHVLIVVIVNSGLGEDAMAAARKAGATGGTLMNAHGTGTEEDVSFFGITLVPEKEMLLIVAEKPSADAIIGAIQALPALAEPGGGIVFTLQVEKFSFLGKK
ncbi:MAG: P-II family nitrogen regulator [Planctomycetota bacterium]|jgi:nitrogen regulatory protein PII|nr:P-II family nitrogen regulator [Planctomycetota bacterium]